MTRGPAAKRAIDPASFVDFLDTQAGYVKGGHPVRNRRCINGVPVTESDLRVIRRWRTGVNDGITIRTAGKLLTRYSLTLGNFQAWAFVNNRKTTIRGGLPS